MERLRPIRLSGVGCVSPCVVPAGGTSERFQLPGDSVLSAVKTATFAF
jgi:hypothetical protein